MKNIKRISAVILILFFALTLSACTKESKLIGKWTLTGGSGISAFMGSELNGYTLEELGFEMSYEFRKDNTCTWYITLSGYNETLEGIWAIKGMELEMEFNGTDTDSRFRLDGDKLVFVEIDGEGSGDLVFSRAD